MITKFKIFETISTQPTLGDYVIIDGTGTDKYAAYKDFVDNNVGKIIKVASEYHGSDGKIFTVKYDNIPDILKFKNLNFFYTDDTRKCTVQHFKYWSDDKEELESIIGAEKYNL
jgi:hypothetical protein